jgi:hypothetical protein
MSSRSTRYIGGAAYRDIKRMVLAGGTKAQDVETWLATDLIDLTPLTNFLLWRGRWRRGRWGWCWRSSKGGHRLSRWWGKLLGLGLGLVELDLQGREVGKVVV